MGSALAAPYPRIATEPPKRLPRLFTFLLGVVPSRRLRASHCVRSPQQHRATRAWSPPIACHAHCRSDTIDDLTLPDPRAIEAKVYSQRHAHCSCRSEEGRMALQRESNEIAPKRGHRGLIVGLALLSASIGYAQSFKILVPSTGSDCAGCTNGGLACFGYNSCEAGCLDQVSISCDTCKPSDTYSCCPSCPTPCSANLPCAGTTPNSVVADTCPQDPSASPGCQYYSRKSKCLDGKCKYYAVEAPRRCKDPPPTTADLNYAQLSCIRQCLQARDATLPSSCATASGCTKVDCIVSYHEDCFTQCGVSSSRFPGRIFRWAGDHDGNI